MKMQQMWIVEREHLDEEVIKEAPPPPPEEMTIESGTSSSEAASEGQGNDQHQSEQAARSGTKAEDADTPAATHRGETKVGDNRAQHRMCS